MAAVELKVVRWVLALIWLVTAAFSFGLYPIEDSVVLVEGLGASEPVSRMFVYAGATLDLVMGLATLFFPMRLLWLAQIVV